FETAADQLQLLHSEAHGICDGRNFGVKGAEQEIVLGNISLQGQQDVIKRGGAGGRFGASAFEPATDSPPEINFVAEIKWNAETVGRDAAEAGRLIGGEALASITWVEIQVRKKFAAGNSRRGASLIHARDSSLEFLIGQR